MAGGGDGSLTVWDLRHNTYPMSQLNAHAKTVSEILFHPDRPENLFTCSGSGELWHWNNAQHSKLSLGKFHKNIFFKLLKKIIIFFRSYKYTLVKYNWYKW